MEIKNKNKIVFYILAFMLILLAVSFYFQKRVIEPMIYSHSASNNASSDSSGGTSSSSGSSACTIC